MLEVSVQNRQKRTRLLCGRLATWTRRILQELGWKRVALSVLVVNDLSIRKLNDQYLGEDRATDVLAFGQASGRFVSKTQTPFLGDIAVSIETARRVARQYGHRWDEELLLYICHGILHLMGYEDSTPVKRDRMDREQRRILRRVLGRRWPFKKAKPLF